MKIAVFEASADERPELNILNETLPVELSLESAALSDANIDLVNGCEAVSTLGRSRLDRPMLEKLKERGIGYVSTRTIGFDHIDVAAAHELGLRVSHSWYPPEAVADFTIMLMLMVLRRYKPALWRQQVNDYSLGGLMGRSLNSQTVGVVGTGNIGAAVIRQLQGFGCRILACGRRPSEELRGLAEFADWETVQRECDIITFHVPCTDATRNMVDATALARMKDGVILVNTARGELMDIEAITEAVENQKIGSLAMDVFRNEQGIYHADRKTDIFRNRRMAYLRQFPNVVLTQHMAFYTEESIKSMVDCGIQSLLDMKEGRETALEL